MNYGVKTQTAVEVLPITTLVVAVTALLAGCSTGGVVSETSERPIFRWTTLASSDTVNLGQPLNELAVFGVREAGGTIRIPMSHPGVGWMRAYIGSDGKVEHLLFSYDASSDFDTVKAGYVEMLGKPDPYAVENGEGYLWDDDRTRFAIVRPNADGNGRHLSVMTDLTQTSSFLDEVDEIRLDTVSRSTIPDVLAATQVWSMISGRSDDVRGIVESWRPELSSDTLEIVSDVIEEHFSPLSLYRRVREYMEAHSHDITVAALTAWLFDDEQIILRTRVAEYEPDMTLEEYSENLGNSPPSKPRIEVLRRFAEANQAAEFYVRFYEALREASNEILAVLPPEAELIPDPSIEEINGREAEYEVHSLIVFLWQYEPLSNKEIASLAEHYESESGRWYVQTYSDALMSALRDAGSAAAEEIAVTIRR